MKKITIQIPDGKKAEWVNGVLTLVDEKDSRPITERVKTFDDACRELGEEHPYVQLYREFYNTHTEHDLDVLAYLKLRIIVAALNEGWEPQFTADECRYFPWFELLTQEEYDDLDEEEKARCVLRSGNHTNLFFGFVNVYANSDASYLSSYGSRLAFKTRDLACYAGMQFAGIYADFIFKPADTPVTPSDQDK